MSEVLFDNESNLYCQNKLINIKCSMWLNSTQGCWI